MSPPIVAEPKPASAPGFTSSSNCVRSGNLRPLNPKTPPRVISYVIQRSPQKPDSHLAATSQISILPLGSVCSVDNRLNVIQHPRTAHFQPIVSSPSRKTLDLESPVCAVSPPSRSRPSEETPVHLLSDHPAQVAPRMEAPMIQRTAFSAPGGTTLESNLRPSHQFLYYHRVPGPDRHGPPIVWNTREVVVRSPPLPRQRSAKACKKCRRRKTKVRLLNPFQHMSRATNQAASVLANYPALDARIEVWTASTMKRPHKSGALPRIPLIPIRTHAWPSLHPMPNLLALEGSIAINHTRPFVHPFDL